MSVYLLEPKLTDEMVIDVFEQLCISEVRKLIGYLPEMQEGFQHGYISCLTDFLGRASDEENQRAYDKGESYVHVVTKIVSEHLSGLVNELQEIHSANELIDLSEIDSEVSKAVRTYLSSNAETARSAIKSM